MPRTSAQQTLGPITDPEPPLPPIIAMHIDSERGFFQSATVARQGDRGTTRLDTAEQLTNYMQHRRNRTARFYAHNGEDRDFTALLPEFLRLIQQPGFNVKPLARDQGQSVIAWIISDRDNKRSYQLRDSHAVLNADLADVRRTFAPAQPIDVLALRDSLITFNSELLTNFDVNMQWSAAGTAMRAWRRTITTAYARQRQEIEDYCRPAYYGGMTYLRSINPQTNITGLDVTGMYAWSMLQGVPTGPGMLVDEYWKGVPGIYRVKVRCPINVPMAMIPCRTAEGTQWPTGRFTTTITSLEIEAARQRGYQIEIIDGVIFREVVYPFGQFLTKCQRLEIPNKHKPLGKTTKLLRNSLYGRFGLKPDREDYILTLDPPEGYMPVVVMATGELLDGLYWKEETVSKAEMQPHWAAWITASARLKLVELHEALGCTDVFYSDTDSVYAPTEKIDQAIADGRITIGQGYGDLKREHDFTLFHVLAPKQYYGVTTSGETINRAKSMPRGLVTADDLQAVAGGARISREYTAHASPFAVIAGAAPERQATRSYSEFGNTKGWSAENGIVRPINREDLQ